jgi:flagellar capping protein FliD
MYSQVATTDELSGNTYYIDREKGKIIFADPVAAGDDVKVSYDYTVSQPGMFNYIYEELKTYTGIGILYQQTNSLSSEVKTIEDNISNLNNRLKNKEERLWKQYTSLETTMNDLNSQSSWLSSQLAQLM